MQYRIIRSSRRSVELQIREGELLVRAPYRMKDREIEAFVRSHQEWIAKRLGLAEQRRRAAEDVEPLSPEEIAELTARAKRVIPERVAYYAPKVGTDYGRITIRHQKTRWGSCSARGDLSFNCLLLLTPPQVLDSVVIHELCHRKEMNHSPKFYAEVLRVCPDYRKWEQWLKRHGDLLIHRMEKGRAAAEGQRKTKQVAEEEKWKERRKSY